MHSGFPCAWLAWNPRAHRDLDVRVREWAALWPCCVGQGVAQLPAISRHLQRGSLQSQPDSALLWGAYDHTGEGMEPLEIFCTCAVLPPPPCTQPEAGVHSLCLPRR